MTQYDFDKLMEKYLRGECNAEEEQLLNDWAARQLLLAMRAEADFACEPRVWV